MTRKSLIGLPNEVHVALGDEVAHGLSYSARLLGRLPEIGIELSSNVILPQVPQFDPAAPKSLWFRTELKFFATLASNYAAIDASRGRMASGELKVARFILGAMGWPILATSWLGSLSPRELIEWEKYRACVKCNRQVLHCFYGQHLPSGKIRRRWSLGRA